VPTLSLFRVVATRQARAEEPLRTTSCTQAILLLTRYVASFSASASSKKKGSYNTIVSSKIARIGKEKEHVQHQMRTPCTTPRLPECHLHKRDGDCKRSLTALSGTYQQRSSWSSARSERHSMAVPRAQRRSHWTMLVRKPWQEAQGKIQSKL
jgi:hypothetical protein